MATMAENDIAAGAENRPPMLEKDMYDSWKIRIMLYIEGNKNGEMLIDSINNGPFQLKKKITIPATEGTPEHKREQRLEDLTPEEKLRKSFDIKATNIILLGLPVDIYTLVNHHKTAKEIWDRVKKLMEGTELTLQERESKLYDDFDRFRSEKGEPIHLYYLRYVKLINDMNIIGMTMTPIQINTKFVNHLLPEWSSYEPPIIPQQSPAPSKQLDSGFGIPSFLPTNDPINVQGRQSHGYGINTGKGKATGTGVINTARDVKANPPRDSEWILLAYAQESRVILHEEQQDFFADRLEEMDLDCEDLQLHITSNFKADHVDAFDLNCDDEATTCKIFMASLSPAGSLNGDTVGPTYDSDILSKVPHYDTYHETNVLNPIVQETEYTEHLVSNNDSYDELTNDNNVISYADYMVTIENDAAQYVPPKQYNVMILSVIKQMQSQVERCNTVNQETKSVNESLCKREDHLDSLMRGIIYDRNKKVNAFKQKRVKDSEWILLAHAQEFGVILHEVQQDFLADRLEETDSDCPFSLQIKQCDTVGPTYDSYILSKVPHYDTYHETNVLNPIVQQTEYTEHLVSNNDSYDELTNENNVIYYADYMVTIKNDAAQYVPPEQYNVRYLPVKKK
ncbi:hypothetical protein Tco_0126976 [Tanacetum coccineum]